MPEPRAGIQNNAYLRKLLRQQWRTQHVADNFPTASILRDGTVTGGHAAVAKVPTTALVAGLSNLPVTVDAIGLYFSKDRTPDFTNLREGKHLFCFLDIPAAGSVAANTMLASDFIQYDSRIWMPLNVENDVAVGLSMATCELWKR